MKALNKTNFLRGTIILFGLLSSINIYSTKTYTIGGAGYLSFTVAIDSLESQGVSDTVVFNVSPGTYNEQITIPAISGASANTPIIFRGATGDSTKVILAFKANPDSFPNHIILLNGASYITFEYMTIQALDSINGNVIQLQNAASNNTFQHNRIIGILNPTNGTHNLVTDTSLDLSSLDANAFYSNYFMNGYNGINLSKVNETNSNSIIIQGNIFTNQVYYAIDVDYYNDPVISKNNIACNIVSIDGTLTAIGVYYCNHATIDKNQISCNTGGYGIDLESSNIEVDSTNRCIVSNNTIIINDIANNDDEGFYIYDNTWVDLINNSVRIDGSKNSYDLIIDVGGDSINVINNNLANFGGGYVYSLSGPGVVHYSNYNNIYSTGQNIGNYSEGNIPNLYNWSQITGNDTNSVSVNPAYKDTFDLTPQNCALNNKGVYLSEAPKDLNDVTRNNPPDIGAIEFNAGPLAGGTYSVGKGKDFENVSNAFTKLGSCGITGPVVFELTDANYHEPSLLLNQVTGASAVNTITIEPAPGVDATIKIDSTNGTDALRLLDVDYLTIDGSNNGTNTRNLKIISNGVRVIHFVADTIGCSHNTVENCIISSSTGSPNPSYGIYTEDDLSPDKICKYNLFENNEIKSVNYGIYMQGYFIGYEKGNKIINNAIGSASPDSIITNAGLNLTNQDSLEITGNEIQNIRSQYSMPAYGIMANRLKNSKIDKNRIHDISIPEGSPSGPATVGIYFFNDTVPNPNVVISDNFIYRIAQLGSYMVFNAPVGISINGFNSDTTPGSLKILYNSIYLSPDTANGLNYAGASAIGVLINSTSTNFIDFRNNIIDNSLGLKSGSSAQGTTAGLCIYVTGSQSPFDTIDYNDYYVTGFDNNYIGAYINFGGDPPLPYLADWRSFTLQDAHSLNVNPYFISNTNLHIKPISVKINNAGTPLAEVTDDIDGDLRSATKPDIGADEFTGLPYLSRHITKDTTLQDTYILYDTIWIDSGVKVTIMPGTKIEFLGNYPLYVNGAILANGAKSDTILFTTIDTTGYISRSYYGWSIIYNHTPVANDSSKFSYCTFEYAGYLGGNYGGAFYINNFNKIKFNNSLFRFNNAYYGGAIYTDTANLTIINSTFSNNSAYIGGAIYQNINKVHYINNLFCNNEAGDGGAIYILSDDTSMLINNTIVNNYASYDYGMGVGGGLHLMGASYSQFYNNIIWGNYAYYDGNQIETGQPEFSPSFYYNDIEDSSNFGGTDDYDNYIANIAIDPAFVNPSGGYGLAYNGYQADWSLSKNSPCINKGKPDFTADSLGVKTDLAGNPRFSLDTVDMGAYEFQLPKITIKTQPVAKTVCEFALNTIFSVVADSANIKYQWQISKNGGTSFSDSANAINNTLIIDTSKFIMNGYQYRCILSKSMMIPDTTIPVALTVRPLPNVIATSNSPVCEGDTLYFSESGGDATSWNWSGPDGFISVAQDPSIPNISSANVGTYTVYVCDGFCNNVSSINVTVNPLPPVTISPAFAPACSNDQNYLLTGGTPSGGVYGNNPNISGNIFNAESAGPGIDTLSYTYTDGNGCSNIAYSPIVVNSVVTNSINATICQGQTYTLPGGAITGIADTYIDTLPSYKGCDSIITTVLTVTSVYYDTITVSICQGNNYNGHTTNGNYNDTLQSVAGCDSIITTILTVNPVYHDTITISICQGNSYNGHTTTGNYNDTLQSVAGCDSIVVSNLTVNPAYSRTDNVSICQGQSYKGHTAGDIYIEHLTMVNGCDSTITTNLTVNSVYHDTINISICQGNSYNGHTTTGNYNDTLQSVAGCDSIVVSNLTVNPAYSRTDNVSICQGQSYKGHTAGDIYIEHLAMANGCDSTVTTNLTVNPVFHDTINISICQGNSYNGHTTTGNYNDTLQSVAGCDSIVTTILTVNLLPIILVAPADTTINRGQSVTLVASGALNYLWSTGDISQSITVSPNNDTVISVLGTNIYGCSSPASDSIKVNELSCNANFSYIVDSMTVHFTDLSTAPTEWNWTFGDGTYSADTSPSHTYLKSGNYNTCLVILNDFTGCITNICKTIKVGVTNPNYIAAQFSYNIDGNTVIFTDSSSSNVTNWYWLFGDGSFSTQQNTSHLFTNPGTYNVCLKVFNKNKGTSAQECKNILVGIPVCNVVAGYTYILDTTSVRFSNTSSGTTLTYYWDFGDGIASSDTSPVHQYNKAGFYLVSLSVKDTTNQCIDYYAELLQIGQVNCKADFDYVVIDDTVKLTNTSTGNLANYYWSFDDGSFSNDQNPVHTFSSEGIHYVSLTVSDSGGMCSNYTNKKIQVGNVNCSAQFSYFIDTLTVSCKNEAIGAATEYYWYFGDGTLSSDVNPVHTFLYPGFYTIGLNTFNSQNWCMDYYQTTVLVGSEGIDCIADFIYQVDTSDNTVKFFDNSKGNITSYLWDFDDCDILNNCAFSSDTNPTYTYKKVGYYDVCLSVKNNKGVPNIACKWIDVNSDTKTNCLAKFNYTVNTSNNTVSFVSQSLGQPNKFKWNFGDSAISYSNDSAVHHYKKGGFYLVSMNISTPGGCTGNSYQVVNIKQPFGLYAMFGYDAKDYYNEKAGGYPVDFVGAGLGDQGKLRWSYGDGGTDSTSNTPTHYYDTAGFYYVCLTYSDTVTKQKSTACDTISTCQNDSVKPVAVCKDIIVTLNGGTATIKPQDVNNGSYDNCAIYDYYIDNSVFNSTGFKLVHLIVTDFSNHKDTCSSIVTVQTDIKEKDYYSSSLMKVFPNPFGDRLSISYQLPVTCNVEMTIFNLVGEPIVIVNTKNQQSGYYSQTYDVSMLESGSYIVQLKTSAGSIDRQVVLKK